VFINQALAQTTETAQAIGLTSAKPSFGSFDMLIVALVIGLIALVALIISGYKLSKKSVNSKRTLLIWIIIASIVVFVISLIYSFNAQFVSIGSGNVAI